MGVNLLAIRLGSIIVCSAFLLAAAPALAAEPITRVGDSCPLAYHRSGAYCMPSRPDAPRAVPKAGGSCPLGWVFERP